MLSLQEKLDASKAEALLKLQRHIKEECEAWADWDKITEKEKDATMAGYEACFFYGFDAAMRVIKNEQSK